MTDRLTLTRALEAAMVVDDVFDGDSVGRISGAANDRTGEYSREAGNPAGGIAEYRRPIEVVIVRLNRASTRDLAATLQSGHSLHLYSI